MKFPIYLSIAMACVVTSVQGQDFSLDNHKEELNSSILEYTNQHSISLDAHLEPLKEHVDTTLTLSLDDWIVIRKMKSSSQTIPLTYNTQVKHYIDKYISSNYRPYMNRLLGLSKHYFKVYEQVFNELQMPREIKYLSLVESSLNPHLISSAGAVGPWQFMYITAKEHDLDMNNHIDERKDIYAATYALSNYLKDSKNQFEDWLLAIASYNCGKGCVRRAIERSGLTSPSFWELAPYLPQETRNYIPKYIAMTYVMENAEYYGITPAETEISTPTKLIMVDRHVDLNQISSAVGVPLDMIKAYNPAVKRHIIPGTVDKPRRLWIPEVPSVNDSLLYAALNSNTSPSLAIKELPDDSRKQSLTQHYKVPSGESIYKVASKFGVTVQNLRAWNGLTTRSKIEGKRLIVSKPTSSRLHQHVATASKKKSTIQYYVVRKGDSLDRIASRHDGVSVSKLKADNGLKGNMIKPGMKLKISRG